MVDIIKGAKRYVGISVSSDLAFTIDSGAYEVKTSLYADISDSGVCIIAGGDAYFLLDTTKLIYVGGGAYFAYITIELDGVSEVLVGKVPVRIVP